MLCGVVGYPLGHSLSPLLHNWALQSLGAAGAYFSWPVEPKELTAFITAVRTLPIAGASVTIPHKEAVMPMLDAVSESASRIGAVNTLYWNKGKLFGENTDVAGFVAPLQGRDIESALILGAGGAARAVLAGLAGLGVNNVQLANRSASKAGQLAAEAQHVWGMTVQTACWEDRKECSPQLLVNTTPLGMRGERERETPWQAEWCCKGQIAYDLVYNPLQTQFLAEAESAGCETIDGLAMFVGQAAKQCELWTGKQMDQAVAHELLARELAGC